MQDDEEILDTNRAINRHSGAHIDPYEHYHRFNRKEYDDFTTIDWVRDRTRYLKRHRSLKFDEKKGWWNWIVSSHDAWSGWLIVSGVGILSGLCAGLIDIGTEWMTDLRLGVCPQRFWLNKKACCWSSNLTTADNDCPEWLSWSQIFGIMSSSASIFAFEYFVYVLVSFLLGFLAAVLVRDLAPYACGSGIPEIKTILSGFVIRSYLGKWVLLIKSLTMMMVVSAGLSLGKEGPLVHVASCCGNMLCRLFPKYRQNEVKKREILSAAAAAGVSVAFGAPIGGILFSLEEVVSYYFPLKTMWRSFFSALMAAIVLSYINPYGNGHLVRFEVSYDMVWHLFELIPFIVLGIFGGLYGAFFIKFNIMWSNFRKNSALKRFPVAEVVVVTVVTALLSYLNPYTKENTSSLIRHLFQQCDQSDSTPLCNYINNGTYVINTNDRANFPTLPAGPQVLRSLWLLALAMLLKAFVTIFTFGIKIPAGLFIPSMAVGACFGRILGVAMEQWYYYNPDTFFFKLACHPGRVCVQPGLYSMVGAAATLGGVTKMTVSLVVIMFELTGGLQYIVPIMFAVMTSKWVGDAFVEGGIYDGHIRLNGYPFLDSKEEVKFTANASEIMQPRKPTILVTINYNGNTVGSLLELMQECPYQGYPLVYSSESQQLIGFITRKDLKHRLDFALETNSNITVESKVYFSDKIPAQHDPSPLLLKEIVDLTPLQVTLETSFDTVLDIFRMLGTRKVLVIHKGRVMGLITKKDILRHIAASTDQDPGAIQFH
ncbi:uncharacterized protein TRIADDRAFT_33732 [Trichoplax adhaerens]|uniref:Chloride channel protein n=1 Tax=Trichoplax adhaerens TaxID=10228 RepID=B3SD67_TRIAD|nr:hypothetical protein TRIADDRAFT_33732 [Trichoplax adhaerens]EDV19344.1 hypothetical protein TRIADDRAFT_33732 [Trichoplax adhaerens]|eukprot:XP_002118195.1 hypothetical protein TRIADDRAFT_33732 [Trichoplax adhaerens]